MYITVLSQFSTLFFIYPTLEPEVFSLTNKHKVNGQNVREPLGAHVRPFEHTNPIRNNNNNNNSLFRIFTLTRYKYIITAKKKRVILAV